MVKNIRRREIDAREAAKKLFEPALARELRDGEIESYAGHTAPMPPNAKRKKMLFKILSRKRKFQGCPKCAPGVRLGAEVQNRNRMAPFMTLDKKAWNFVT